MEWRADNRIAVRKTIPKCIFLKDAARFHVSEDMKDRPANSSKASKTAPRSRRSVGGKNGGKKGGENGSKGGNGAKGGRRGKKRKWTKRKVRVRAAVVSEEAIRLIVGEWRRWLWAAYRARDLSLQDVAAEIGATRQGLAKLLARRRSRFFFDSFLRACFLRREAETGFTIAAEGWKYQLRWTVERCNRGCLSSIERRA